MDRKETDSRKIFSKNISKTDVQNREKSQDSIIRKEIQFKKWKAIKWAFGQNPTEIYSFF